LSREGSPALPVRSRAIQPGKATPFAARFPDRQLKDKPRRDKPPRDKLANRPFSKDRFVSQDRLDSRRRSSRVNSLSKANSGRARAASHGAIRRSLPASMAKPAMRSRSPSSHSKKRRAKKSATSPRKWLRN